MMVCRNRLLAQRPHPVLLSGAIKVLTSWSSPALTPQPFTNSTTDSIRFEFERLATYAEEECMRVVCVPY
jgi:hypothetical protein